ncbi:MAG TPA: aminotransferase class III-fold pyridoxal phosphate-dependent enzyme [Micromonosporaceae bacterium]|jgi:adenosylmethionine-8-amino-7-oxononanoate aminotransferase
MSRFWRGFSDIGAQSEPLSITRGAGSTVWDAAGNEYVDATGGLWYCAVGYGRDSIAAAAAEQMRTLHAYSTFGGFTNEPAERLAARIAALSPLHDPDVFLCSGGSDAVDTAIKMAFGYWARVGHPERDVVLAFDSAYHGMHGVGTAIAGIGPNRMGNYTSVGQSIEWVPLGHLGAFVEALDRLSGRIAAVIGEPVQGAGGVHAPADPDFWPSVAKHCAAEGALLIGDEVITGFGRLGSWFAAERFGYEPDLITFAKQVTSGYAALGGVIAAPRMREAFGRAGLVWRHGYTYGGHATACAVALENLDIMADEHLVAQTRDREDAWISALKAFTRHKAVAEVRAIGLVGAVQLQAVGDFDRATVVARALDASRANGVLTRGLAGDSLQLSPPLVITEAEVTRLVAGLDAALETVSRP